MELIEIPKPIEIKKFQNLLMPEEKGQIIIHGYFRNTNNQQMGIRIWETSFLYPHNSAHKSKLLQAFNIGIYPNSNSVPIGSRIDFSLIFSGLPKSCESFDLVEEIPIKGGFHFKNIQRNETDVYRIMFC
jgi:hypothetical protein